MTLRKNFVLNYILPWALFQVMTEKSIYPLILDPTLTKSQLNSRLIKSYKYLREDSSKPVQSQTIQAYRLE